MVFRKLFLGLGVAIVLVISMVTHRVSAAVSAPQLVISQFKITSSNGQFVTLFNQSDAPIDLGQYEIDYVSSTSKLSSIPISGQLAAHGFYMLNDDQLRLCYQMTISAVSLGFTTTSGSLQVWQLSVDKTSKLLQDSVSWASKATAGVVTLPAQNSTSSVSLLRQPTNSVGNPQITSAAGGSWQAVTPDVANPCNLDMVNTVNTVASPTSNPGNQLSIGQAPPVTIINITASDDAGATTQLLPQSDIGLSAPQLTELLPNPAGTGNDATDEYIEMYNPNPVSFDLTGFTLQTGTTTKHNYVFPQGTTLPAAGFTAFYAGITGLSLSNTSGLADLLDPFGNTLTQSDAYGTAKDGQSWALANGKWYWTSQVTPGAVNVIKQIVTASKATKTSTTAKKSTSGAVKGAATTVASTSSQSAADATTPAPIHPTVLAAVAALAVGYGVYEYRHDLANKFHQFGSNRAARRKARL